ncbi:NAD-dependent epimerase/dehydratase family protein [Candidatus Methylopumilus universalis]|uniref:NAD-dependent epimerase/dehydratase family protein n=1 Tax=Candidatus Methylopumilus universalis TaxID=2588536 RepID=A0AAX1EZK0_9PROT|nr:NAD-dependent epimerase/dehydratase family protein [Candidatus Methylopumilus universalis]QDC41229.1 NAD-dependent epimerase/dehydratase family protein [Candidatus Methylopumilus universalis]QDC42519.1 NAD-dependent epimerase/dehydratase family protein [Candidatus Methylopumilus universalis]QDC54905.1 NAD-dependent epimerase/dehydratase family protein [Candidatus Methylopumilus universalis]QDC56186.1 NAD-dependent epimerase/dehydratase family protein [Candidatus Methylopumilus universalis]Q
MNILVTGASGFIGASLVKKLADLDFFVFGISRHSASISVQSLEITEYTDFSKLLIDIDCVIHLAARVHFMGDTGFSNLKEYRRFNVKATENLVRQSIKFGVKRFIFLSSIKVNGELTVPGQKFAADDKPCPQDAYSLSKYEAEKILIKICKKSPMSYTIIRPPMVYGPGVKGNFLSLMKLIKRRIPLPIASVTNKRSVIFLDNLVDLIIVCINHPAAKNEVFLASDNYDISIKFLSKIISEAFGVWHIQIPMSERLFKIIISPFTNKNYPNRIFGSLEIDITKTIELLNWLPPIKTEIGLKKTVKAFYESSK